MLLKICTSFNPISDTIFMFLIFCTCMRSENKFLNLKISKFKVYVIRTLRNIVSAILKQGDLLLLGDNDIVKSRA